MAPTDQRLGTVVVDRAGYDRYRLPGGAPVLDPSRHRVTLLAPPLVAGQARPGECAEVLAFDIDEAELTSSMITAVHHTHGVDRIVVFPENLLLPMAELRERLGIEGPRAAEILPFRDKPTMKETAQRAGIPVVDWIPVETGPGLAEFLGRHGEICLKPRDGAGSADITLVRSPAELAGFFDRVGENLHAYQAERLVDAGMIHVDAIVLGGRTIVAVTSQYLSSTLSHVRGRPLSSVLVEEPNLLAASRSLLDDVIAGFAVRDAVLHLEAFVHDGNRLVFNEVACRAGGGGIVSLVQALTGYNLFEAMVRMAHGEDPSAGYEITAKTGGFALLYGGPGVLEAVDDEQIPPEWIVARKLAVRPGEFFTPVGRAGGSLVSYVVRGDSQEEVTQRLRAIEERVDIRFRDVTA